MDKKIENIVKVTLLKQQLMIECLREENGYLKQQENRLTTALNKLELFEKFKR